MLIMIDNYDSFTYNLVQYFGELGVEMEIYRNDQINLETLIKQKPSYLVISPGPGNPEDGGISNEAILHFSGKIPVLGVCLGHQCMGAVFGGQVSRAQRLMHGKVSRIHHYGTGIFAGIPSPFEATRYHSLIVESPLPDSLEVSAFTSEGEVMGLKHRQHATYGVQFHPEAILTQYGKSILKNFLQAN